MKTSQDRRITFIRRDQSGFSSKTAYLTDIDKAQNLLGSSSSHELSFICGLGHSGLELGLPRYSSMVTSEDIASGRLSGLDVPSVVYITLAFN
jgi:hypothetical protein